MQLTGSPCLCRQVLFCAFVQVLPGVAGAAPFVHAGVMDWYENLASRPAPLLAAAYAAAATARVCMRRQQVYWWPSAA